MLRIIIVLNIFILLPGLLLAHGPSRQKVLVEMEINAQQNKIWMIISDFCSIQDWHPSVIACESSDGNKIDSIRTLTLENGQQIQEKLIKLIEDKMRIQYMLVAPNTRAFPINTHGSTLSVEKTDDGSLLQWKGAFYRAFPGPNPPPDQSDEAGRAAIKAFYDQGLNGIKTAVSQ